MTKRAKLQMWCHTEIATVEVEDPRAIRNLSILSRDMQRTQSKHLEREPLKTKLTHKTIKLEAIKKQKKIKELIPHSALQDSIVRLPGRVRPPSPIL